MNVELKPYENVLMSSEGLLVTTWMAYGNIRLRIYCTNVKTDAYSAKNAIKFVRFNDIIKFLEALKQDRFNHRDISGTYTIVESNLDGYFCLERVKYIPKKKDKPTGGKFAFEGIGTKYSRVRELAY